ncbi:hypothetical protein AB0M54_24290 [Actinoplanes sp. NPDC051470]|uniref:hypothetical protein n=1 Tax=Actinoplanes sp. NPDC051470 TaxID=3157224 RepID=UPI0034405DC8
MGVGRPWDVRVWLYPTGSPAQAPDAWGLEKDISAYVKYPGSEGGQAVTYSAGRRGESAVGVGAVDYSQMSLSLDNKDGRFCPDNVMGTYWPDLDLNTPIRMGVVTGYDGFDRPANALVGTSSSGQTYTVGSSYARDGTSLTCAIASANSASRCVMTDAQSTNFDITATAWVTATATGGVLFSSVTQYIDASNYVALGIDFRVDGTIDAKIHHTVAGSFSTIATVTLGVAYAVNQRFRIRGMRDGATVYLRIWKEADPEPATWTTSATETGVVGGNLGIWTWRTSGNTNAGTQFGYDDLRIIGLEFTGYVTEWPTEWDMTGRNSWAAIKAAGILRRLRQVKTGALESPLRRQLPAFGPVAYWPLEDGERATTFGSAVQGQQPAKYTQVTPAADSSLPGALVSPTLNAAAGSITAYCTKVPTTNGFAVMWLMKPTPNPAVKTRIGQVLSGKGPVYRFEASINIVAGSGVFYMDAYDDSGVLVTSSSFGAPEITDWSTTWHAFCLITQPDAAPSTYLATLLRYRLGDPIAWFTQNTYASTIAPQARVVTLGGTSWDGSSYAHLGIFPNTLPFVSYAFFNAATAFDGESMDDRADRISVQAGIPVAVEPGTTVDLGPQPRVRPIDIVQAGVDADFGLLYESGNGLGIRPREARRNQPVLMNLSVAAGHIAEPPRPIRDDQRIRNKITVTRDGGSSVTSVDEDHIERVGEYEESVTIGVHDDRPLQDHADFRRFTGTRPGMRWSNIALDFARNPGLLPTWRSRQHAFRLTVTTGRTQVTGADPDLLADGYSATLDNRNWTVSLECSDATVWDTGVWDDPTANRSKWGPTGATLDVGINTAALSIAVNAAGETWKTGAVSCSISIDGEHIPITSVAGPVSGVYTLTASARAANGVSKSHSAGAAVTFANNKRWGF